MIDRFRSLKEFFETNLFAIVAVILIAVLAVGYVTFYIHSIAPGLESRDQLAVQLEDAQKRAGSVHWIQKESPQNVQTQLTNARATLTASASAFLTADQASKMIDTLYQHARTSSVTIVDLQVPLTPTPLPPPIPTQTRPAPTPTSPNPTQSKSSASSDQLTSSSTPAPTLASPTRPPSASSSVQSNLYHVRTLRLRVQGTPRQLVDFASRIKELSAKGILVTNFNIVGSETTSLAILHLELALYVLSGSLADSFAIK